MERVVEFLIPPAARDVVAGDLREMCSSPRQYGLAALKTLPFIIASQARRNANLPLLCLQGVFLFACLVSLGLPPAEAGAFTLMAIVALLLRDAYQPVKCPTTGIAIFQALSVSMLIMLYMCSRNSGGVYHLQYRQWFIAVILPFFTPVMGMLRASLILRRESQGRLPDADMALEDMARDYRQFEQRMRRANQIEITALFAVMAIGAGFILYIHPPRMAGGWAFLSLFASVSAWLLVRGTAPGLPRGADFATLRTLYKHELARQNQIRRFMWWLWFAPVLALLVAMMGRGMNANQPLLTLIGTALMVLAGFWIATLNRERGGFVSEKIGALALMRERRTP
jgi:hypothetical protein